jgi:prophage regulatory protein
LNAYALEEKMRVLRLKDVIEKTGLARSTIYKYVDAGTFPKPIPLGGRSVGWVDAEVHRWITERIENRDIQNNPINRNSFA